ncbi:MAG TPA: RNA methyltransferase [Solirubrobacteraceae bacterium]|nr:RNA methyltransferase [Solirubrobacteraceae bacterium]
MPTTPIKSIHNERLKQVRRLRRRRARDSSGLFVAEGEDLLAAADAAGWKPWLRLCADGSGLPGEPVEPALLERVSTLGSGTRALAVYEQRWTVPSGPLCVYLHGVADPGNVGAILRSAAAFGAASVVLGPGSVDPYGAKAVRASMGAIFSVAVARSSVEQLPGRRLALIATGGDRLRDVDRGRPVSLVLGAERAGLPADVVDRCDAVAHIPIRSDSLNVAMAATVALYELTGDQEHRMAAP